MEVDGEVKAAEIKKLNAEKDKIELEAEEIKRRLSLRWWESQKLGQYVVAIVITSVLLFGWAKAFLEPFLRREIEINSIQNHLLESRASGIEFEREKLRIEIANMDRVVSGLNIAVRMAAKSAKNGGSGEFFSILNEDDPINDLKKSFGWGIWSDNRFSKLGYYLVIQNEKVFNKKEIIIARTIEMEEMKKENPLEWKKYTDNITKDRPLIILDYSYFGILVDRNAPVGGEIYLENGIIKKFYAPLNEWSHKLSLELRKKD